MAKDHRNHHRLMCPSMIQCEVGYNSRTELALVKTLSSSNILARHALLQLKATCIKHSSAYCI